MDSLAVATGASSGIGYFMAKELAGRGSDLVVCSTDEKGAMHEKMPRPMSEK